MKKKHRRVGWTMCLMCNQLVHGHEHECPPEARAKKDAELDMVIDVELSTWDADVKKFWKSKDVRFAQHLLDEGKYE